ncbi:MAG TPA: hypothetical protein VLL98_00935 [Rickettsiales bacterium]|nr:hypothetical protein [Rickettsiales bacterium]
MFKNIIYVKGNNNALIIAGKKIKFYQFVQTKIKGNNNIVEFCGSVSRIKNVFILIEGNNNHIKIGETNGSIHDLYVNMKGNDNSLNIGKNFSCGKTTFTIYNGSNTNIGNNCTLASEISIWTTDGHYIYDKDNSIMNLEKDVNIGNHVWICDNCTILKGSCIDDNCVLGNSSILTKNYKDNQNCVIVGSPAKIIKNEINWGC